MSTEVKVGIVFFIGLGLALGFTLFVTDIGSDDAPYKVRFNQVLGLEVGAPVTYNGVKVGSVEKIAPELVGGAPSVMVYFDIFPDDRAAVLIGEHTRFYINQGLLGGAVMGIINTGPGQVIEADELASHMGEDPVSLNDAMAQINDMIAENRDDIRKAIAGLPDAVNNVADMAGEIRDTVSENRAGITDAITGVKDMTTSITHMVEENREGIQSAVANFGEMSSEIRDMIAENRGDIRDTVAKLPAAAENLSQAAGEIRDVVKENRNSIRQVFENLANFAPKLDKIGDDVGKITSQIASGRGTIGRLVYEDTLHTKAVKAVDSFEQRLEISEALHLRLQ